MKTINKLLARLTGYQLIRGADSFEIRVMQRHLTEIEQQCCDLSEENTELKRKLANKTAGEYYWRKQAREARR